MNSQFTRQPLSLPGHIVAPDHSIARTAVKTGLSKVVQVSLVLLSVESLHLLIGLYGLVRNSSGRSIYDQCDHLDRANSGGRTEAIAARTDMIDRLDHSRPVSYLCKQLFYNRFFLNGWRVGNAEARRTALQNRISNRFVSLWRLPCRT